MPPLPTPTKVLSTPEPLNATTYPATRPDTLQIGEYTIGSGDCQELYGHPDIRY